ncbi:TPA: hypothetical protein N0F65_004100 [Lagenidium giganteum]|uniref:Uncharacterized protein n=1 Tax=Lagenidium giganteum TaxID=4803 RepID=A0AAV2Z9R0_9STRA|nr:TPA: hypothetical protein N0F65_004100 [Lagenidium giganteum]
MSCIGVEMRKDLVSIGLKCIGRLIYAYPQLHKVQLVPPLDDRERRSRSNGKLLVTKRTAVRAHEDFAPDQAICPV